MITYVHFTLYSYIEDVLPGDSKAIGIICALLNLSCPELYSPEKTTEKIWPGDEVKHERFCSLKASSFKTGIKH